MAGHDGALWRQKPATALRQITLAADIFLRLQLGHAQEMAEHLEAVTVGKLHQLRRGFCNEDGGLFRPTLAVRLMVPRPAILSRGALPAALFPDQAVSESECSKTLPFLRAQLKDGILQLLR